MERGCGYQTAVLAKLAREVYSLERIGLLLTQTRIRLQAMQIRNIYLRQADGMLGLSDAGPFDGIMMTAVTPHVTEELLGQLAVGGRMVFPKINQNQQQNLCIIERSTQGFY